ncbi:hypothetical protein NEUTE1DRAFT_112916 [Neurospora tetrasperma FGSC 2508]|uniref:Uncharacterized protein n=1 Tax=Neurospora tetrasperma (strain FGSC 2508 / ATCC MYA-4615 / P0657) TaxID=510951 RepID=F8MXE0_NEUT8|nr:uncharacterized protein NEUTE1DRAFT_112916 [Neurospora tetrasperma FGSC 2508]EGO54411.1 hypothetical protein NEUTE1DRAFT_112916 [Neurospora tetrasperma FGSC 2508]EGZ68145.1 hypothetical protein NEUTE2DRAFT_141812 [Neurospora tetrasperma FGSC 2509]
MYSSSNSEVTEPTYTPSQFSQLFSCLTSTMPSPIETPGPRGTNAINNISDTNKDKGAPNPRDEATQLRVGVSGRGTHPLPVEFPPLAAFEHAGILSTAPDEVLPGTFMITDEHRRDDDDDEDEEGEEGDEILFMRPSPNSSHASSSRVGTMSRSRYSMLGTTQRDGKDESDSDSDSDGGAPLFTPSRDKTLGNSGREENRAKRFDGSDLGCPAQLDDRHQQEFQHGHWANSNTKADALNIYHHRPKTLLASFRPGIPLALGIRTEPDPDAHPAYFSTRFIVQRAVARLQARRLNGLSSLDYPERIESLTDGEQQTNGVEQHHINGRGTYYNPPASPLPTQASKPLTTTTTTRKPNYSRPPTETSTTENPTASIQLGPFTLSPSDVALLASSEASFERLTTPKFHPAFSGSSSSSSYSHRESRLVQDSAEEWTDVSLDGGGGGGLSEEKKKKMKKEEEEEEEEEEEKEGEEEGEEGGGEEEEKEKEEKAKDGEEEKEGDEEEWEEEEEEGEEEEGEEEEGEDEEEEDGEEWEWVDHPMDKYRVGCMHNYMERDRGYVRNEGFGRREEE